MMKTSASESQIPVLIEFAPGSRIRRSEDMPSPLDPDRNQPGNTWVVLKTGEKLAIPSDQVVLDEDQGGRARVGLGGMSFEGMEDGKFVLWRVRDVLPEELIAQDSGDKLTLHPDAIARIQVQGTQVYPRGP